MNKKALGQLIRQARQSKHWSQQDLADAFGCSQQNISDMERGEISIDLEDLDRLAGVLGTDLYHFFPIAQSRLDDARQMAQELASLPDGPIRDEAMAAVRAIARDARRRAHEQLEQQKQRAKT